MPSLVVDHGAYGLPVDLWEQSCDCSFGKTGSAKCSDLEYVGRGQDRPSMSISPGMPRAALVLHVMDVVGLGADEQVLDVNAEPVIAPVEYAFSFRVLSFEKEPSSTMREPRTSSHSNGAVAVAPSPDPEQAPRRLVTAGLGQEALLGSLCTVPVVSSPVHGTLYLKS